jgi:hypothetical protein
MLTRTKGGHHARRAGESRREARRLAVAQDADTTAVERRESRTRAAEDAPRPTIAVFGHSIPDDPVPIVIACPYGTVGDLLYVTAPWAPTDEGVIFRADTPEVDNDDVRRITLDHRGWHSGRYLRRVDARMLLRVTDVRAQRVRHISEDDARAEGVVAREHAGRGGAAHPYTDVFFDRWNEINGALEHHRWQHGPWVWALTFELVAKWADVPLQARPIPFQIDLVRAIIEQRKTQTRRLLKRRETGRLLCEEDPGSATLLAIKHGIARSA